MRWTEVVWARRSYEHVAVETQLLLDVLPHVRVIPVNAGVGKPYLIREAAAWRHRQLRHVRDAVEPVVETHAVPVHGSRLVQRVRELNGDRGVLWDVDERPRILIVEGEH